MDTQFAATVVAVIEEGSIVGAARRLSLTPGAVALRIKVVEEEVGANLTNADVVSIALPPPAPTRTVGLYSRAASRRDDLISVVAHIFADRSV